MSSEVDGKAAQQLTRANRYKELFRRYGKIALGVHLAVYASFFAGELRGPVPGMPLKVVLELSLGGPEEVLPPR